MFSEIEILNDLSKEEVLEIKKENIDTDVTDVMEDIVNDKPSNDVSIDESDTSPYALAAQTFAEAYGIDPEGEYEDSAEGFTALVEEAILSRIPEEALELAQVLNQGGSITEWKKRREAIELYENVDMDDKDTLKELCRLQLESQGLDKDEVSEMIQSYEDKNKLEQRAEKALDFLQKAAKKENDDYLTQVEAENDKLEALNDQARESFMTEFNKFNSFGETQIPKNVKEEFKKYLFEKNSKGETRMMIDSRKPENILKAAFLQFKQFSTKDLIAAEEVKAARKLLNKARNSDGGATSSSPTMNRKTNLFTF